MMSERMHTPGPWHVEVDEDEIRVIGKPEWKCSRNGIDGEWDVATITDLYDDNKGEMLANARLIAAAPELLDAIYILQHHGNLQIPEEDPDYAQDIAFVRAAVAKAEGGA